jgi:hypothetical protein
MAKPRIRTEGAVVVELSASCRAVLADGVVYLHKGPHVTTLTDREAQVLAAVVGTGDVPQAIAAFLERRQVNACATA